MSNETRNLQDADSLLRAVSSYFISSETAPFKSRLDLEIAVAEYLKRPQPADRPDAVIQDEWTVANAERLIGAAHAQRMRLLQRNEELFAENERLRATLDAAAPQEEVDER